MKILDLPFEFNWKYAFFFLFSAVMAYASVRTIIDMLWLGFEWHEAWFAYVVLSFALLGCVLTVRRI